MNLAMEKRRARTVPSAVSMDVGLGSHVQDHRSVEFLVGLDCFIGHPRDADGGLDRDVHPF